MEASAKLIAGNPIKDLQRQQTPHCQWHRYREDDNGWRNGNCPKIVCEQQCNAPQV
ncbi:hypothetical protein AVEN_24143-1, partial [Araneus ventricosus]